VSALCALADTDRAAGDAVINDQGGRRLPGIAIVHVVNVVSIL